jgi:hypothetical protein
MLFSTIEAIEDEYRIDVGDIVDRILRLGCGAERVMMKTTGMTMTGVLHFNRLEQ